MHALAPAPDGGLYVGTSPDGKIYKVDRNGAATTFFDPDDKYIWALAVDARATSTPAPARRASSTRSRRTARARRSTRRRRRTPRRSRSTRAGNLLVGTESPGRVLRDRSRRQGVRAARLAVPGDPRAAVRRQGHAVRRGAERPPPAAAPRRRPTTGAIGPAAPSRRARRSPSVSRGDHVDRRSWTCRAAPASQRVAARGSRARRRAPSTASRRTASGTSCGSRATTRRTTSTFDQNGALIVGTGSKGKIYRLEGDPLRPTLLARAGAQQVTAFYKDAARPAVLRDGESRQAVPAVVRPRARAAPTSPSRATRRWSRRGARSAGAARCRRGSQIELFTRSGNTETPDDTWSAWSAAYTDGRRLADHEPEGALPAVARGADRQGRRPGADVGHRGVPAAQPAAAGALDHRPSAGHRLPEAVHDRRAGARRLRRSDDARAQAGQRGDERAAGAGVAALGRRTYQKGLQTLVWKADDENDDELVYDVLYRREGETAWKTLRARPRPSRSSSGTRRRCRTARTSSRSSRRTRRRIRRARALTGELRERRRSTSTTRRRSSPSAACASSAAGRSSPSTSRTTTRRSSASSSRRTASGGAACFRWTGSPTRRTEHYELAVDGELGERGLTLRASDSMNNVDDDPRRRAARQLGRSAARRVARARSDRVCRRGARLLRRSATARRLERRAAWSAAHRRCARRMPDHVARRPAGRRRCAGSKRARDTASSSPSTSLAPSVRRRRAPRRRAAPRGSRAAPRASRRPPA